MMGCGAWMMGYRGRLMRCGCRVGHYWSWMMERWVGCSRIMMLWWGRMGVMRSGSWVKGVKFGMVGHGMGSMS